LRIERVLGEGLRPNTPLEIPICRKRARAAGNISDLCFILGAKKSWQCAIFLLPSRERFSILVFVVMEIMKSITLASRTKFALLCVALAAPSLAIASDVVLQKAPPLTIEQAPSYPENLARYHFGAQITALPQTGPAAKLELSSNGVDQNASEAALLCDDPTIGYQLPAGQSSILVSLANIENIEEISLLNEGAQGSVTIAVSNADVPAKSPEWRELGRNPITAGTVTANVGPGEAKYVKLTFDVTTPGRIAAFGVYATPAVSDFTMPRPRKVSFTNESAAFALINYNFTDLHMRARGLYASSGDVKQVNKMIDDQPATAYQFAAGDREPTVVIDLGRQRTLSRISAVYAAQPGSVDFYVLNSLPLAQPNETADANQSAMQKISNVAQAADLPGSLKLSDKNLAGLKAVGSVASTDKGRAAIDFPATTGRYIMLKWHPASLQGQAFSIAQVAAFGHHQPGVQGAGTDQMTEESASTDENDGKDFADGKSILDNKDIPREGPAGEPESPQEGPPPALPNVPPFTFIPEVSPTSP
jgi:hypothetical protein